MVELKTSAETDAMARDGATSPFLNYHPRWAASPFPAVLCVPVDFGATLRGWTPRTASGARAAHSEHTVAVTADGAPILTS